MLSIVHQRLAAGDDAGVAAFAAEHVERFVKMFGANVIERGGLHGRPPTGDAPWQARKDED